MAVRQPQLWPHKSQLLLLLLVLHLATLAISSPTVTRIIPTPRKPPAAAAAAAAAAKPAAISPPSFCYYGGSAAYPGADQPTSMSWGGNMFKVYHNLYHHNRRWYAVVNSSNSSSGASSSSSSSGVCSSSSSSRETGTCDVDWISNSNGSSSSSGIDAGMSINTQLVELPTTNSSSFQENVRVCYVPGVTLFIDFPFAAFPDNLGHWAEILLPTFSVFSNSNWTSHLKQPNNSYNVSYKHIDRILLPNVKPEILYNWPREFLALAIDPATPPWPAAAAGHKQGSAAAAAGQQPGSAAAAAAAAGAKPSGRLPPGLVPWDKPLPQLLGYANLTTWCTHSWMLFENVIIIQDRYSIIGMPDRTLPKTPDGVLHAAATAAAAAAAAAEQQGSMAAAVRPRVLGTEAAFQGFWRTPYNVGFNKPDLAASFRAAAAARHLWGPPHQQQQQPPGSSSSSSSSSKGLAVPPRVVTVLMYPEDYPPVVNHHALVDMLRNVTKPFGFKVRTVSLTMGAPFLSHMATMSDTGLLIARHGPLLASAVLLPPGAAVLELLPYKWEWKDVSSLYYNMTQSTGYLHHWVWRPLDSRFCKYKEPAHVRYSGWTPSECQGRECLLVHAQAGLEVGLKAVAELLERKLPGLIQGQSIEQLQEPWPPAE